MRAPARRSERSCARRVVIVSFISSISSEVCPAVGSSCTPGTRTQSVPISAFPASTTSASRSPRRDSQ